MKTSLLLVCVFACFAGATGHAQNSPRPPANPDQQAGQVGSALGDLSTYAGLAGVVLGKYPILAKPIGNLAGPVGAVGNLLEAASIFHQDSQKGPNGSIIGGVHAAYSFGTGLLSSAPVTILGYGGLAVGLGMTSPLWGGIVAGGAIVTGLAASNMFDEGFDSFWDEFAHPTLVGMLENPQDDDDADKEDEEEETDIERIADALVEIDMETVRKQIADASRNPSPLFGKIDYGPALAQLGGADSQIRQQYVKSLKAGGDLAMQAAISRLKQAGKWPLKSKGKTPAGASVKP